MVEICVANITRPAKLVLYPVLLYVMIVYDGYHDYFQSNCNMMRLFDIRNIAKI